MRVTEIQNEANHLLFLYFTSIGVIQRDSDAQDIDDKMNELAKEIKACKVRLNDYLNEEAKDVDLCKDYYDVINEGKEFVKDGISFIDRMLKIKKAEE